MRNGKSIILENDKFRLVLSSECVAESLVLKSSNTELNILQQVRKNNVSI